MSVGQNAKVSDYEVKPPWWCTAADANARQKISAIALTKTGKYRPPGIPDCRPMASNPPTIIGKMDRKIAPAVFAIPLSLPLLESDVARFIQTKAVGKQNPAPI
eukprot:gnl/MRDRNA2_/MRDRNA2_508989_c0_seq1.p2 gnl/MRDRNA2_/MRDRNA2_508989_c0~~gnl/MRDRNA2_/MRDRNA2_508989_c0_seq1.p2  ORF type:complete len:104 (+),score=17.17 gnl/MRDRNA2_/MRDRNA2_508989_c0_seq1:58-369(+)